MKRFTLLLVTIVLTVSACGDDAAEDAASTTAPGASTSSVTIAAPAESSTTTVASPVSGTPAEMCAGLFSLAEVEALFAEPAAFDDDEGNNGFDPSLGRILCSWSTIENPADLTDLAFQTLVVQVYVGDPIEGTNFYSPDDIYPDARHIEGIGDDAFVAGSLGLDTGFLDGPVAGFLSYAALDVADGGGFVGAGEEKAIEYLRLLHERVGG